MKTLILPGFSLSNKDWGQSIKRKLKLGHKVQVHNWRHWEKGGSLSFFYELEKILESIGEEKANIIAKSVGTRVTVNLLPENKGKIEKVILCGIPLRGFGDETKEKFKEALSSFPARKIIVIQNQKDPFSPFEKVKKFIKAINPKIKVVKKERSDHNYPYSEDFQDFLE